MKLRLILLILCLLAFLSAATGGFLYYSSVKGAIFKEAERQAQTRLAMIKKNLSSFLAENIKPVKAMAGMQELSQALARPEAASLQQRQCRPGPLPKNLGGGCLLPDGPPGRYHRFLQSPGSR